VVECDNAAQEESTMATKKKSGARKRELMEPTPGDKRFVRRDQGGKFRDVVDVGRSLAADRRSKSKTAAKSGQGDKGDVKRAPAKKASAKKSSAKKAAPAKKSSAKKAAPAKKSAAKKAGGAKKSAKSAPKKK
jgi:hypothetical protein